MAERHAVILANLGGPTGPGEVRGFLKHLFSDPDIFHFPGGRPGQAFFSSLIANLRQFKSRKLYAEIGGGSPIVANTRLQAEKLAEFLRDRGEFTVIDGHRYSAPFLGDRIEVLKEANFDRHTLIPLFPQFSTTTTQSVINEWERCGGMALRQLKMVRSFYYRESYLKVFIENIRKELGKFSRLPQLLFCAHSIPVSRIEAGDPYEKEVRHNMEMILDDLGGGFKADLSWQSRVGPVKWLEPSVSEMLKKYAGSGIKDILLVPLSFVSEHLETLYELDIEYREEALKLGIEHIRRVATPSLHPEFIRTLGELVMGSLNDE